MRVDDTAVSQDDSGLLHAGRVIAYANSQDKAVNTVGFGEFDDWIQENELDWGVSSKQEFGELKSDIVDGSYDVDEIREVYSKLDSEPDIGEDPEVDKDFSVDIYRVLPEDGESGEDFGGNMLGFAVDFPNSDVYVEWNNKIFPDPLKDGHVSIYSSLEDLETATNNQTELVDTVTEPDTVEKSSVEKQMVEGYPDLPLDDTPEEVVNWLHRLDADYNPSNESEALLYQLLGSGTPEWKMSKEDADYKDEPEGDAYCGNCEYAYYSNQSGRFICSKIRGKVDWEGWCRLWDHAEPDPLLEEEFGVPDGVDKSLEKAEHLEDVVIGGQTLTVEVADDDASRYTGLSKYDSLGDIDGMLFKYPREEPHELVWRDMSFPIDVIHLDKNNRVVKTGSITDPDDSVQAVSKNALELPLGFVEVNGIEKGDQLELANVLKKSTPEGVPDNAEYVSPDKEPPENAEVYESPYGGTYITYEEGDDNSDRGDEPPEGVEIGESEVFNDAWVNPEDVEVGDSFVYSTRDGSERIEIVDFADEDYDDIVDKQFIVEFESEDSPQRVYADVLESGLEGSIETVDVEVSDDWGGPEQEIANIYEEEFDGGNSGELVLDLVRQGYSSEDVVEVFIEESDVWDSDEEQRKLSENVARAVGGENTTSVDGFDDNYNAISYRGGFADEAWEKFEEDVGSETAEKVESVANVWTGYDGPERVRDWGPAHDDCAPIWQVAAEITGNDNVPRDELLELDVSQDEIDALEEYAEYTQELLRDIHGDEVTVFRGLRGEVANELKDVKEDGGSFDVNHRPAESWAPDPQIATQATQWDGGEGVVITKSLDVDDIMMASHTGALAEFDNEYLTSEDGPESYNEDQVLDPSDASDFIDGLVQSSETVERSMTKVSLTVEADEFEWDWLLGNEVKGTYNGEPSDKGSSLSDNRFDKFVGGSYHRARKVRQQGEQLSLECFECLSRAFREQVWPDELQKSPSWASNDDVDEETAQWVSSIIELEDPMWDEYENVPMAAGLTVKQEIKESLTQPQGWSLESIANRLGDDFPHMEEHQRNRIARQEVAGVLNRSKIASLLARPDDPLVRWVGPDDGDTTELCKSLVEESSDGVPISEMLSLLKDHAKQHDGGTPERAEQGLPHWLCRHTVELVDN